MWAGARTLAGTQSRGAAETTLTRYLRLCVDASAERGNQLLKRKRAKCPPPRKSHDGQF